MTNIKEKNTGEWETISESESYHASKGNIKEEFDLSKKEVIINTTPKMPVQNCKGFYPTEDVKEFIRLDTELIFDFNARKIFFEELLSKRRLLAGERLCQ